MLTGHANKGAGPLTHAVMDTSRDGYKRLTVTSTHPQSPPIPDYIDQIIHYPMQQCVIFYLSIREIFFFSCFISRLFTYVKLFSN